MAWMTGRVQEWNDKDNKDKVIGEPFDIKNTTRIEVKMSENKDTQYRGEFEHICLNAQKVETEEELFYWDKIDDVPVRVFFDVHWIFYLAGRRKGQEELDKFQETYDSRVDMLRDLRDEGTSQFGEIESLKKEIEELKMKPILHKVSNAFRDQQSEIEKLRELVIRAKPFITEGIRHPDKMKQWSKEAELILK